MEDANAYDGLLSADNDARWAFGTGFEDALHGVDTSLPAGVDASALATYCLALGDDALIMSQSLQRWMSRLPELEEEAAVANIALDLLGQARLLLSRAGLSEGAIHFDDSAISVRVPASEVGLSEGAVRSEDDLAFGRDADEFSNVALAEWPDADFAQLVVRLLIFSLWRLALLDRLRPSADPVLAALGARGVKEVTYHLDYAVHWTLRLGDGTAVSHERTMVALSLLWPHVGGLFEEIPGATVLAGVAADVEGLEAEVRTNLTGVLRAATLTVPTETPVSSPGRRGRHTPGFAALVEDMQSVARALPGGVW